MRVSFSGFMLDPSGFGEAARRLIVSLRATPSFDLRPGIVVSDGAPPIQVPSEIGAFLALPRHHTADVHLIHAAATDLPRLVNGAWGRQVGLTCWETTSLHPLAAEGCRAVDLVVLPSIASAKAFAGVSKAVVVPYPLDPWGDAVGTMPALADIPASTTVFYSVLTWQARKFPEGILTAYLTAFDSSEDVELVLKVTSPGGNDAFGLHHAGEQLEKIMDVLSLRNPPKVKLVGGTQRSSSIRALHRRGDVYVNLSRGEAFSLPTLDAWALGNAIIATKFGGHTEFAHEDDGVYGVRYMLTPVQQRYRHFDGTQNWAEPDLLQAQTWMRTSVSLGRPRPPKIDRAGACAAYMPAAIGERFAEVLRDY